MLIGKFQTDRGCFNSRPPSLVSISTALTLAGRSLFAVLSINLRSCFCSFAVLWREEGQTFASPPPGHLPLLPLNRNTITNSVLLLNISTLNPKYQAPPLTLTLYPNNPYPSPILSPRQLCKAFYYRTLYGLMLLYVLLLVFHHPSLLHSRL